MNKEKSNRTIGSFLMTIFLLIQLLLSSMVVFFSASGLYFKISPIIFCSTLLFVLFASKYYLKEILSSSLFKLFLIFFVVMLVSFVNFVYYDLSIGAMLKGANKMQLFFFSIIWFLNFCFFFIWTLKSPSLKKIQLFSLLFFIAAMYSNYRVYLYFRVDSQYSLKQHHYFYFLLTVLPLCYIWAVKWLKYLLLGITFIAVLLSLKRSGILVCLIIIFFLVRSDTSISKGSKFKLLGGVFFLVTILFFLVQNYMSDMSEMLIYRMGNLSSDGGSGRGENVMLAYNTFIESSFENQLFGNGFWSMNIKYSHFVDVEWFSILYYYGVAGFIIYCVFFLFLIKRLMYLKKEKHYMYQSYLVCFIIFAFYSIASELFTYQYLSAPLFIYLGVSEGIMIKERIKIN